MKLAPLLEAKVFDPTIIPDLVKKSAAILLGVAHAKLTEIETAANGASFVAVYEFPEHRNGLVKEVKTLFKRFSTDDISIDIERTIGRLGEHSITIHIFWDNVDLTTSQVKALEDELKKLKS